MPQEAGLAAAPKNHTHSTTHTHAHTSTDTGVLPSCPPHQLIKVPVWSVPTGNLWQRLLRFQCILLWNICTTDNLKKRGYRHRASPFTVKLRNKSLSLEGGNTYKQFFFFPVVDIMFDQQLFVLLTYVIVRFAYIDFFSVWRVSSSFATDPLYLYLLHIVYITSKDAPVIL